MYQIECFLSAVIHNNNSYEPQIAQTATVWHIQPFKLHQILSELVYKSSFYRPQACAKCRISLILEINQANIRELTAYLKHLYDLRYVVSIKTERHQPGFSTRHSYAFSETSSSTTHNCSH